MAIENDEFHVLSLYKLGCISIDEGMWEESEKYFLEALEVDPIKAPCKQDVVFMLHQIRSDCKRIENQFINNDTQSEYYAKKLITFQKLRKLSTLKAMVDYSTGSEGIIDDETTQRLTRTSRDYFDCFQKVFARTRI